MQVSVLLQSKGADVVTMTPDLAVAEAVAILGEHRIGAVVVSADGTSIDGVLSERDIVRALAGSGAALGIAGAWIVSRSLQRLAFGTSVASPVTLVVAAAAVAAIAALAAAVPAPMIEPMMTSPG